MHKANDIGCVGRTPPRGSGGWSMLAAAALLVLPATSPAQGLVPLSGAQAIQSGGLHSCVLTTEGAVRCWGLNNNGQLGDGTATRRLAAVDANGLDSGATAVAVGSYHTCAIVAGGVKCWGANTYGALGDGTTTDRRTAVDVVGLASGVTAIAAGGAHTCALTDGGGVKCWGANFNGALGDGTAEHRLTPVDVAGLDSGALALAVGRGHSCALIQGGIIVCWGNNGQGQLGDGTLDDGLTPVGVIGLSGGATALTAGEAHSCALTTDGGARCWGRNDSGALGDGTTTGRLTAVDVAGLTSGVTAITAGQEHTCALAGAAAKCWGWNGHGQLGDGTTTRRLTAVDVSGLTSGVAALSAAGYEFTCALTVGGGAKCWGENFNGTLGDGTTTGRLTPVDVLYDANPAPALVVAASRKVHGAAGAFDLPLSLAASNPTTEPRRGGTGASHTVVFTFDKPVTAGNATLAEGTATLGTAAFDGIEMIVPLSGVTDSQYVTVSVSDVVAADGGTGGAGTARIGFLPGDVSQNRVVTVSDLAQVNAQIAQVVTSSNYLMDVNASGTLTVADKGIANTQITKALPAP